MILTFTITVTWASFLRWAWLIGEPVGCLAIGLAAGFIFCGASFANSMGRAFGW